MSDGPKSTTPAPQPPPFAGCALIVIGTLILIPSGLCTAVGGSLMIVEISNGGAGQLLHNLVDLAPFIAGTLFPLALGGVLIWAGLRVRKG